MPRRPRIIVPEIPMHVIQRGNNRQVCFVSEDDYLFYLQWLKEYAEKTFCQIHAYVLMTNHVHLLVTSETQHGLGQLMKRLGQRYVQYFNRSYKRSGTLWEGRYRSCLLQQEGYLLACQRYIELNPVRAGMVEHPADYPWSSYHHHGDGEENAIITRHQLYEKLGRTNEERQKNYRELFRYQLEPGLIDQIRKKTNGNFVLGDECFAAQIEQLLGRRVVPGKAGRPKKIIN